MIRLNVSWSLLEPTPGRIDKSYIERIAQVVAWAKAAGIYVVIDMHQDAWSKYVYTAPGDTCVAPFQAIRGFDGAPLWASQHVTPACALNGVRELDPAVQEDFQKLYDDASAPDGVGLQEHYANAVLTFAQRFQAEPTVAGHEIINELSPGFHALPGEVDATELYPFYGKVVNYVVSHVPGYGLGGTLWLWKENANDINRAVFWGVYGPPFAPGTAQPLRIVYTSRAFPLYTADTLKSFTYDPSSASFDLQADSSPVPSGTLLANGWASGTYKVGF